jgi:hypothetical protein
LAGYSLSNEAGHRYLLPDVTVEPGYTVIVSNQIGMDGVDGTGQLVVYWPTLEPVWDLREDTALLTDPAGAFVDMFHYKGKRVLRPPPRTRWKAS